MAWDFFQQFNSFADLSVGNLTPNAFTLYIRLLMINNKAGRIEWFGTTNERLMVETGLNIGTLTKARNDLIQMGFIEYKKGKKSTPSIYKLVTIDEEFLKESKKYSEYFRPKTRPNTNLICDQKRTENATENAHHNREEKSATEKSREAAARAREGDLDFDRVVDEFSRHSDVIRPIRPDEMAQLSELLKVHGEEQVLLAIAEAAKTAKERGEVIARGVKYLAAILERWKRGDKSNVEFKRDIATDRYAAVMARNN